MGSFGDDRLGDGRWEKWNGIHGKTHTSSHFQDSPSLYNNLKLCGGFLGSMGKASQECRRRGGRVASSPVRPSLLGSGGTGGFEAGSL